MKIDIWLTIVLLFILANNCKSRKSISTVYYSENNVEEIFQYDSLISNLSYLQSLDKLKNMYYANALKKLEEPILIDYKGKAQIFRFIHLQSFLPPYCLRIVKIDSNFTITKKVIDVLDKSEKKYFQTRIINLNDWEKFTNNLEHISFWKKKSHIMIGDSDSRWILEGVKNGKYHIVDRWCPNAKGSSKYARTCKSLNEIFESKN